MRSHNEHLLSVDDDQENTAFSAEGAEFFVVLIARFQRLILKLNASVPGRLPWAIKFCAFGAPIKTLHPVDSEVYFF